MRHSAGFALLVVVLAALPRGVSAQTTDTLASDARVNLALLLIPEDPQQRPEEPDTASESEAQFGLEYEGGAELDRYENKVRGAKIGLGVSSGLVALGGIMAGAAAASQLSSLFEDSGNGGEGMLIVGLVMLSGGGASMIATGILLGVRKHKLRELQQAQGTTPRRVQWDLAKSRLVF
jgi:hypothetical protein